ncbi:hypothetical protein EDD11_002553 [Mortierella claussenii]|nr:hypothetical protein EDD11_002553 [Mortierella claussenii]
MNDLDMDDAFDFKALSLDEPEERLQKSFESSFHINNDEGLQPQLNSAVEELIVPVITATPLPNSRANSNGPGAAVSSAGTPDQGPWAKRPSPSDLSPFQPGVTAQKLDAMAMDPNHVFKSAQTPFPFPFTAVPTLTSSDTQSAATSASEPRSNQGKSRIPDTDLTADHSGIGSSAKEEVEVPEWMQSDAELTSSLTWDQQQQILKDAATGPNFSSQDFSLGWGSSDLSTTVDSNALFGFSSYPTFESLPISATIAEEMYRQTSGQFANTLETTSTSLSYMKDAGGFAKYGSISGNQWLASSDPLSPNSSPLPPASKGVNIHQWQGWRTVPERHQDVELDFDEDLEIDSPKIKDD